MIITKGLVLSFIARLFDPLGFLTPFSVKAKIIFQQLWVLGIEWNTCIPDSLAIFASEFDSWLKGLCELQSFNIFRRCTTFPWTSVATRCDLGPTHFLRCLRRGIWLLCILGVLAGQTGICILDLLKGEGCTSEKGNFTSFKTSCHPIGS